MLQALFLCGGIANGLKQDFMVTLLLLLWIGPGSLDFHSSREGCAIVSARSRNEKVGPRGRVKGCPGNDLLCFVCLSMRRVVSYCSQ